LEKKAPSIAVLYTPKGDLLSAFRAELKNFEVQEVLTPNDVDDCLSVLSKYPDALFILDFSAGVAAVDKLLGTSNDTKRVDIRPSFLFSQEEVDGLEGAALEYRVSYLHVGEITRDSINYCLRKIIELDIYPDSVKEQLVEVSKLMQADDLQSTVPILESLRHEYPDEERFKIELAEVMFRLNKYGDAESLFSEPGEEEVNPRWINIQGRIALARGDFVMAGELFNKAKLINPFNIERLIGLGEAYLGQSKLDKAEKQFREAHKHGSKDPGIFVGLGKTLLVGNQINEALKFLKRLSGDREMASVFNSAAVLCIHSDKFLEGMKLYTVALKTVGEDSEVRSKLAYNMGIGYHRNGDHVKAHKAFGAALCFDAKNIKAESNFQILSKAHGKLELNSDSDAVVEFLLRLGETEDSDDHSSALKEENTEIEYDDASDLKDADKAS